MTKAEELKILRKLENSNIRSDDMYSGDVVNGYLNGSMSRSDLKFRLANRRKEIQEILKGIDKLLTIVPKCPKMVEVYE